MRSTELSGIYLAQNFQIIAVVKNISIHLRRILDSITLIVNLLPPLTITDNQNK